MLDLRKIRLNPEAVSEMLKAHNIKINIDEVLQLDEERRRLLATVEEKKALRNTANKNLGLAKKKGASEEEIRSHLEELRVLSDEISTFDARISEIDAGLGQLLLQLPNLPHPDVPCGLDEKSNRILRCWKTPRAFLWEPKSYWEIGNDLTLWDAPGDQIFYRGAGAKLERSLQQFCLNTLAQNNYEEIAAYTPLTQEAFSYAAACSPCPEILPLSMHCNKILSAQKLPLLHCTVASIYSNAQAHSDSLELKASCAIGMTAINKADQTQNVCEKMLADSEKLLQLLELPYRVVMVASGLLTFNAASTYAIEVWIPSLKRYIQAITISCHDDFQARRAGIRYRENEKEKPLHAHTITAGGPFIATILAAILENNQNDDGTVAVPSALVPYLETTQIR